MTALELLDYAVPQSPSPGSQRCLRKLLSPLFREVASAYAWRAESVGFWNTSEGRYWMPRLVFNRPGEQAEFKLGIFAGIHGDEPAGVLALCDFVRALESSPVRGRGYSLHVY